MLAPLEVKYKATYQEFGLLNAKVEPSVQQFLFKSINLRIYFSDDASDNELKT